MVYCDVSLVRLASGLEEEVRDTKIRDVRDEIAIPRLNDDIQTRVEAEEVKKINGSKKNKVDGENKTFYLKETHDSFRQIGDLNDDGEVTVDDIHAWAIVDGETRVEVKINSLLDKNQGKFTAVRKDTNEPLNRNAELYVRYRHAPVDVASPNSMVSIACAQLTAAYCFSNIETPKLKDFSIGDVNISKQSEGFSIMMDQYTNTMRKIVNRELIQFDENENSIEEIFTRYRSGGEKVGTGKKTLGRFAGG